MSPAPLITRDNSHPPFLCTLHLTYSHTNILQSRYHQGKQAKAKVLDISASEAVSWSINWKFQNYLISLVYWSFRHD